MLVEAFIKFHDSDYDSFGFDLDYCDSDYTINSKMFSKKNWSEKYRLYRLTNFKNYSKLVEAGYV